MYRMNQLNQALLAICIVIFVITFLIVARICCKNDQDNRKWLRYASACCSLMGLLGAVCAVSWDIACQQQVNSISIIPNEFGLGG